jgi:RimJ/RimL family protein N-acetyltransferase
MSTSVRLALKTRAEAFATIEAMNSSDKAQVSADWLARLHASSATDPWVYGFAIVRTENGEVVGNCGFTAPPGDDGEVEIAYGVAPEHQGRGYATEAARALIEYAFASGKVRIVRAHTLPTGAASIRVLAKCGFRDVGEIDDPQDGRVRRFERGAEPT